MSNRAGDVVKLPGPEARLKRELRQHLGELGFRKGKKGELLPPGEDKDAVRRLHGEQRAHKLAANQAFLNAALPKLLSSFADGSEINPANIRLFLRRVRSNTVEADLFRLASLTWSHQSGR